MTHSLSHQRRGAVRVLPYMAALALACLLSILAWPDVKTRAGFFAPTIGAGGTVVQKDPVSIKAPGIFQPVLTAHIESPHVHFILFEPTLQLIHRHADSLECRAPPAHFT